MLPATVFKIASATDWRYCLKGGQTGGASLAKPGDRVKNLTR